MITAPVYRRRSPGRGQRQNMRRSIAGIAGVFVVAIAFIPVRGRAQPSAPPRPRVVALLGVTDMRCDCTLQLGADGVPRNFTFRSIPIVLDVEPGTPAYGAILRGDSIVDVNGESVLSAEGGRRFAQMRPFQAVTFGIRRGGRTLRVRVTPSSTSHDNPLAIGALTPHAARARAEVWRTTRPTLLSGWEEFPPVEPTTPAVPAPPASPAPPAPPAMEAAPAPPFSRRPGVVVPERSVPLWQTVPPTPASPATSPRGLRAPRRERLEALEYMEGLEPLEPREPLQPLEPLQPVQPLQPLQPLQPIPPLPPVPPVPPSGWPSPSGWFGFSIRCNDCGWAQNSNDDAPVWESRNEPVLARVAGDSPAGRAGLRVGDRITHIDGVSILTANGARRFGAVKPGQRVKLTVARNGVSLTREMVLTSRPEVQAAIAARSPRAAAARTRPLRYTGRLDDVSIEVWSAAGANVERLGDTITISVGGSTVRLKVAPQPERDRPNVTPRPGRE